MSFNFETSIYEGFIYSIKNQINQKIYIGQTIRDIQSRIANHKSTANKRPYKSKWLYQDVQKYGWDSFEISMVRKIESPNKVELKEELDKAEKIYIQKLNTIYPHGYNINIGGSDAPIKEVPVYQFDKQGNLLKRYKSITNASKSIDISRICIHDCCNGKQASAGGYIWSWNNKVPKTSIKIKQRCVGVFDLNNNLLNKFNSPKDAAIEIFNNTNKISGISKCLSNRTKTAYGFIWKYI